MSRPLQIKVCGMTQAMQVSTLGEMGVDYIGFIFYPASPRYVGNKMRPEEIKAINGSFKKVGVFVNADKDEILNTVEACGLDMVQLHGDEAPLLCEKIAENIPVIKAFRLLNNDDVLYKILPYREIVDYFLFDTNTKSFGGSGKRFDWSILENLSLEKPFFLSGGISEEHLPDLKLFQELSVAKSLISLDINSRFETEPGVKDLDRIQAFIRQLKVNLQ
ncbi:phosphoribosylanthranilate isomerase [Arachidicoccus terrestris]|uniref:phosphoribosylanthranilate isomerase n=1 Tax=Arachidicoccus terrestris TaxID=2875539 RepID=UPI001CC3A5A8|nr:phosphoribosylanthranilate isomerase [Arachidicoccus terrestris]